MNIKPVNEKIIEKIKELIKNPSLTIKQIAKIIELEYRETVRLMKKFNLKISNLTQFEIDTNNGWKICNYCQIKKELKDFRLANKSRYKSKCGVCDNKRANELKYKRLGREKKNIKYYYTFIVDGEKHKECSRCHKIKLVNEFSKRNDKKDKLSACCKKCQTKINQLRRQKNLKFFKDRDKRYREEIRNNPDRLRRKRERNLKYYYANQEIYRKRGRELAKRPDQKLKKREYVKNKMKNDIEFRITHNLRRRVSHVINPNYKSDSTLNLIGCTIPELRKHLESKFLPGMSWDNYGFGDDKWHVDHIIPCAAFDLTQESEQRKCFNYTNLQPLWQNENFTKNDKLSNGKRARDITKSVLV